MFTILTTNAIWGITLAHWLFILSAILSVAGSIPYLRDMLKGKTKPNRVTWGLWAFVPLIATGAALAADADPWATLRIFMTGVGPILIFFTSFFVAQSYWKLTKFDYSCGLLSLVALGAWLLADSPVLAILLAALADLLATLPTLIKSWKFPETETILTYFIGLFTASIIIPAIPVWNIENSAFQIYSLIANVALFLAVLQGYLRRKKI